jgi:hypothetical protein
MGGRTIIKDILLGQWHERASQVQLTVQQDMICQRCNPRLKAYMKNPRTNKHYGALKLEKYNTKEEN